MTNASAPRASVQSTRTLGALLEDGTTTFRVRAPERASVDLVVCAPPSSPSTLPTKMSSESRPAREAVVCSAEEVLQTSSLSDPRKHNSEKV